jgi:predicted flap endonuclease-1-like 5' DNA nuclease
MRLDYTLYGLAIIFFIVAAVSLVVVSDQTVRVLLTITTAVIGLVSISAGFILKPKVQAVASVPAPLVVQEMSAEQPQSEVVQAEVPVDEASKIEATPDSKVSDVSHADAVSQVDVAVANEVAANLPVETSTPIDTTTETPPILNASVEASVSTEVPVADLTRVKGIGEKRTTQLKANGITCIDDLARADALDLAAKLKVSPKIVEKWVVCAKDITK